MALSDYLKKLGIVEDDKPATDTAAPATPAVAPTQASQPLADMQPQASSSEPSESLLSDLDALRAGIEARIKSLPESQALAKFLGIVNGIKNSVPDEATRFKAAAEVIDTKFEDLASSLAVVGPTLEAEKSEFEATFVQSVNSDIANVRTAAETLEKLINEKSAELAKLTDERASLLAQTIKKQTALDKANADFKSVLSTVASTYDELASKLERHLKKA